MMLANNAHPALLSCINCRQRKVKCNKAQPCSGCQRSNVNCVFPARVRLPRGRKGGSGARTDELSRRLSRLEGLVGKFEAGHASVNLQSREAGAEDIAKPRVVVNQDLQRPELTDRSNEPVKDCGLQPLGKTDGSRYLGGDFWTSLSTEVSHGRLGEFLCDIFVDIPRH